MLFLLFQIGPDRYALDIHSVAEILPLVQIAPMPSVPISVVGVFNYRGTPIPVVDLSQLLLQRAALKRFNTRLVIVHYQDQGGAGHLLGLIAERATETVRHDPGDFAVSGLDGQAARHVGPIVMDETGIIQRMEVHQLIPASLRELLFQPAPGLP
jgi:chemotaxis-related protein WspB